MKDFDSPRVLAVAAPRDLVSAGLLTLPLVVALLVGGCSPADEATSEEASPVSTAEAPPSPTTPPETVAELVDRTTAALSARRQQFELVELEGEETVRTGRVQRMMSDGSPVLDLVWMTDGVPSRVTSDGEAVYFMDGDGELVRSSWSEAGAVLYSEAAGSLLPTALNPSSFARYQGSLAEAETAGALRAELPLPSGGGWSLEVSTESWLPVLIGFQGAPEEPVRRLRLEPVELDPSLSLAELALRPLPGSEAKAYFAGPAPGELAPEVQFALADGSEVSLADLRGSVVVLDFWATWCVPCRPAMTKLEELYQRHREEGLRVYGLRLFDSGDATKYLADLGITYPIGEGAPFVGPYAVGTYGLPTLYLIDREGVIRKLLVGFNEAGEAALVEAVEAALAG